MSELKWRKLLMMTHGNSPSILVGVIVVVMFVFVCPLVFVGLIPTYATSSETDQVNITVPVSCTLDGTGMDSHIANIQNRNYETEIGSTTLTAYCNDVGGFSIYAIGYSNEEYGNTNMIGVNTEELIPTGTTLDGSVSNWAMKLETNNEATYPIALQNGYNVYKAVPSTYTLVAKRESSTDTGTSAIGSVLTSTYAISVSASQVADTYVGKVRYTLVHPHNEIPPSNQVTESGKICYYPNTAIYEGTMGCQTIGVTNGTTTTSAILLASNYSRNGYGFAGWSDAFDYETNPDTHFYGPQTDIYFTEGQYGGTNPGLSLYAVWVPSVGSFQDESKVTELCGNGASSLVEGAMNLSSVSALTDLRDNQTYAIAKLADGNCWMIENLRIEAEATRGIVNERLAQGYDSSFIGLADPESPWASNSTVANNLYSIDGSTEVTITGDDLDYRIPRYNNVNTARRSSNPTGNNDSIYGYGNYYTWTAAVANVDGAFTSNQNETSICPSGWKLPRGGLKSRIESGQNDYYSLIYALVGAAPIDYDSVNAPMWVDRNGNTEGSDASFAVREFPNNFVKSGDVGGERIGSRGSTAVYWTATPNNSILAFYVAVTTSQAYPATGGNSLFWGRPIRCMVRL